MISALVRFVIALHVSFCCCLVGPALGRLYDSWLGNLKRSSLKSRCECQRKTIQECTCFEVLQLNSYRVDAQPIDPYDIKKGYRVASLRCYHPDKGGNQADFLFMSTCREFFQGTLRNLRTYLTHLEKLEKRKSQEQWGEETFRARIDQFNEVILRPGWNAEAFKARSPPPDNHDTQIDRLFLFLDDSASMVGKSLGIGHKALREIEDRIERTPTSVHFIRTDSFMKFSFNDNPSIDEILSEWKLGGFRTKLWEYIFNALHSNKRPGEEKDEAVIITDGLDNMSNGAFYGIEGFNEMMTQLVANGVSLRISVLCIGNEDKCQVGKYRDLAHATGGVFSNVDPQKSEEDQSKQLSLFAGYITASNGKRSNIEISSRETYEQACISGTAVEFTWYKKLGEENKGSGKKTATVFQTVDI